ncbi:hypothetical protein Bca4012_074294 [Brassica carinata]
MASNNIEKGNDNLYSLLGLKKECTTTELRTAYKKLALRWHPDRCSSTGNLEFIDESKKKFQGIQEAYAGETCLGMGDFLSEMAVMMNQSKPSENHSGDSFEHLQDLFHEMLQGEAFASPSPSPSSCYASTFTSSCSFVFDSNTQQSPFKTTSSMGINDPFAFDSRPHTFSLGVEHQQDFKKGKNNGGRRSRRKNNAQSASHQTSSSNNYGVPTS